MAEMECDPYSNGNPYDDTLTCSADTILRKKGLVSGDIVHIDARIEVNAVIRDPGRRDSPFSRAVIPGCLPGVIKSAGIA